MSATTKRETILTQIAEVLEQRKQADPAESYVAGLYKKGEESILRKIGEEAVETILASKSGEKTQIIYETADLWFHTLVMLSHHNIDPSAILDELERRFGLSGLEEKRSRQPD